MTNRMEFEMSIARNLILKEINGRCKKNLLLSPLSIRIALSMLASGSTGKTLEQLLGFLESDSITHLNAQSSLLMELATREHDDLPPPDDWFHGPHYGPKICLVNGIWVDKRYPMKNSFKQLVEDVYKANARCVDFFNQGEQVKNEINSWAKEETKGHIDPLLTDISKYEILVLANALYFRGNWRNTFHPSNTQDEDFHLVNGETIRVPFMKRSESYNFYGSFEGFKLLKLPYRWGPSNSKRYNMYIYLPDKTDGLRELVENFNSDPKFLLENCELQQVKLKKLWLPKLKYKYELNSLDENMKELGLDLPFNTEKAEIKEIVETSEVVYVSQAIHKSYIDINEEGTTATAVTALGLSGCAMNIEPAKFNFIADHPFLFMIKEEGSSIVLFVGAAINPLSQH